MRVTGLFLSLILAGTSFAADRFPYVFQRSKGTIIRISGSSLEGYQRIKNRYTGQFIWLSTKGREYLIRDAAVLADANKAFAHMDALEPQLRAAEERLRPIEKKFEAIEDDEDHPSHDQLEREYEAAEHAVELLDDEVERREKIAEQKFEQIVIRAIESGKAQRVD